MLSRVSLEHTGILPWCPSHKAAHAVRSIPWTYRDPPLVSLSQSCPCCPEERLDIPRSSLHVPLIQLPMLSGGSLGHPGILPSCTLRQWPNGVRRIPWTSRDPPLVFPQTQDPKLSGGSLGHPGIPPWCPLRHRTPSCLEDPRIPGLPTTPVQNS